LSSEFLNNRGCDFSARLRTIMMVRGCGGNALLWSNLWFKRVKVENGS